jgi:large subunit ribosomal protein L25
VAEVRIAAESRTEFGKGAARRVRRDNKVPAVLYGHGAEVRHISLPGHELMLALKVQNALLTIELDGASELALPKAVQRDPIRGSIDHVDLIMVRRGEKVTVEIPVQVTGEIAPDGMLDQQMIQIAVEAEATHIPTGVEVDVEGMEVGDAVHAGDLRLPSGTTLAVDPELLILHVISAPTAEQLEAELGIEPAEGEAAEAAPPAPDAPEAPAAEDSGSGSEG